MSATTAPVGPSFGERAGAFVRACFTGWLNIIITLPASRCWSG